MENASNLAHHHRRLAMLLAGLSAMGPFSFDAYLPSMHEIARQYAVTPAVAQQTLTAFMIPFAVMTLWQGAISDALGRRRVTLTMLATFFLASIGCVLSWSFGSLMFFRALQGMTAGAGMVIGRAVVRDVLDGAEARRLMAHVAIMFALAPSVAPVIGGWLQVWFGWRSVFTFMALFSATMWYACWREMPETLPPARRQPLRPKPLLRGYWDALRSRPFIALVLAVTLNFSGLFVYVVSAPAFIIDHLHLRETQFLWLFAPITCGILIGTWISARLAHRVSNRATVGLAYVVMGFAALSNLAFHLWHPPALPWSIVPLVFYCVGNSMAMPSLTLMALDLFPTRRGLASSCQSFTQSSGNAIVTAIIAPLAWGSTLSLSTTMAILLTAGLVAYSVFEVIIRALDQGAGRSGAAV
jgi:DHA1 family bicyclomycin/chloramphenicol resistance-like MFS transporter